MKRKLAIAAFVVIVLVGLYPFAKDAAVDWYFENQYVRETPFPTRANPDHIVLTWPGDPATTAAINWRTSPLVTSGAIQLRQSGAEPGAPIAAEFAPLEDRLLESDPLAHRFTAIAENLAPATDYEYRVQLDEANWTEWTPFATAPANPEPFSFIYLGDPQRGFEEWGQLVRASFDAYPNTAFYVVAGDLVNNGAWRNQWDEFFEYSASVFSRAPIVPCLGNHDVEDDMSADMYFASMALPENGPDSVGPERAFSFTYSNALFVVLDSNLPAATQTPWLDEVLSDSTATWKFAVYHHPAYSSAPHRDNKAVREQWGELFDRHHVDIAFQGHDHAYLRTFPMRDGARAASPAEGTIYLVSVSGTKFYEQEQHDYAEVAFPETMTYQTIDIETEPNKLTYRAYGVNGETLDEFTIEK